MVLPICLYGDEGRGRAKTPVLVISWHPVIGGSDHSLDTKLLWTTMLSAEYLKSSAGENHTLFALVTEFSLQANSLFREGSFS